VTSGPNIIKTDVTPAILSRDFVTQLYRAIKLQYATVHVAHCNFVAQTRMDQSAFNTFSRRSCTEYSAPLFRKGVARLFKCCVTCHVTLAIWSHDKRVHTDSKSFFSGLSRTCSIHKHELHEVKKCIYKISYQCICITAKKRKCNT